MRWSRTPTTTRRVPAPRRSTSRCASSPRSSSPTCVRTRPAGPTCVSASSARLACRPQPSGYFSAMAKDHGPSVKNDEQYEALRDQGASKEKAARIANADTESESHKGGKAPSYEDWNKDDLEERAAEI